MSLTVSKSLSQSFSDFPNQESLIQNAEMELKELSLFHPPANILFADYLNFLYVICAYSLSELIHPDAIKKLKERYLSKTDKEISTDELMKEIFASFLERSEIHNHLKNLISPVQGKNEMEKWLNLVCAVHAVFIEQFIKIRKESLEEFKTAFRVYVYTMAPNILHNLMDAITFHQELERHNSFTNRYIKGSKLRYLDVYRYEDEHRLDQLTDAEAKRKKEVKSFYIERFKSTVDNIYDLQHKNAVKKFFKQIYCFWQNKTEIIISYLDTTPSLFEENK